MKVLITGAGGFLGRRLAAELAHNKTLAASGGEKTPISELYLTDVAPIGVPEPSDFIVRSETGDLSDPDFVASLASQNFDSIFHLASMLTMHAERDPGQSYLINTEALRQILDQATDCPKLVFASSIAVFGGALPDVVDDNHVQEPSTTYGVHKAINEQLIADYSRHGRVDGRCLRLPIVLTRPGAPQPVVSDIVASILREPVEGRALTIPLNSETVVPIASAGAVVRAMVSLHDAHENRLPAKRALNLPALTISVADMVQAVRRYAPSDCDIAFAPDTAVQAIVDGWPKGFVSHYAADLGISGDVGIDAVIDDYLNHREV